MNRVEVGAPISADIPEAGTFPLFAVLAYCHIVNVVDSLDSHADAGQVYAVPLLRRCLPYEEYWRRKW